MWMHKPCNGRCYCQTLSKNIVIPVMKKNEAKKAVKGTAISN